MSQDRDFVHTPVRPFYFIARVWCQVTTVLYFRLRVFNVRCVPRLGPIVFVSNHQSFLDPPMVGLALPRETSYMARDSLFKNRVLGWMITCFNSFPVKRNTADVSALKEMMRRLKDDRAVVVFPEGTRTPDGEIQAFHPGFAPIAKRSNATVIPVVIEGAFQAWPRWAKFPRPRKICLEYCEPISPEMVKAMTADELIAETRRRMLDTQKVLRKRMGLDRKCK